MKQPLEMALREWHAAKVLLECVPTGNGLSEAHVARAWEYLDQFLSAEARPLDPSLVRNFGTLERHLSRECFHEKRRQLRKQLPNLVRASAIVVFVLTIVGGIGWRWYDHNHPKVWEAEYFKTLNFQGPSVTQKERSIRHFWHAWDPLPKGVPRHQFSARFTSCLRLEKPTRVLFNLGSDDGSLLSVNGKSAIENWGFHGVVEKNELLELPAGTHALDIAFMQGDGPAQLFLLLGLDGTEPTMDYEKLLTLPPCR